MKKQCYRIIYEHNVKRSQQVNKTFFCDLQIYYISVLVIIITTITNEMLHTTKVKNVKNKLTSHCQYDFQKSK